MDVTLLNQSFSAYREVFHQTRIIQESAESVVPDTDEDIGRIAGVSSGLFLKSKDVTSRGVMVTGEATAAALYITEDGKKTSFVRFTRQFTVEYEIPDIDSDTVARIELNMVGVDVRTVNPRKLSAAFEISGELFCYRPESVETLFTLPEEGCDGVYVRTETAELVLPGAVCEKTCAVTEQFSIPSGKPVPSRIIFGSSRLNVTDSQPVGSKIIVKGTAEISLLYLSDSADYPVQAEFSAPFSQIVDAGEEGIDSCTVNAELTNGYYDLVDSVTGEKALSVELHCVLQLVCRKRHTVEYVSDLYSNLMPTACNMMSRSFTQQSALAGQRLPLEERIRVSEDCTDVLYVGMSVGRLSREDGRITACVFADIIYRDAEGKMNAVRRSMETGSVMDTEGACVSSYRLCDVYLRPDGGYIDCRASVELNCVLYSTGEIECVTGFTMDETASFDRSLFPSVNMVRWEGESLWELAKTYHSSVELIRQYNPTDEPMTGKMLLIPKAI